MSKQVLFEPFPKQMLLIDNCFSGSYRVGLYGGGIRSGKTFGGLGVLLMLCKAFPFSRWAIVRDSLPTLKRNTVPSFEKICPASFIREFNRDTYTVTFTNGSQILFFSENYDDDKELNRWKGLEVNGFLLEEINELRGGETSFLKAIERAGSHLPPIGYKKAPILVFGTCNPNQGWVKKKFYDRWKRGELPEDWFYIPATVLDNPLFANDADYMKSLKDLPPLLYDCFVNGNWDVNMNEHPWLYAFDETKHIRPVEVLETYPIYLSFDFNANPLTCTAWQRSPQIAGNGAFCHAIDEFGGHMKLEELCSRIRTAYPKSIFYVTGDRSGNNEDFGRNHTAYQMIQNLLSLSEKQLNLNTSNLEHFDSRMLCNMMFTKYPVIIDPCCENLIDDIRKAKVDINHKLGSQLLKDREENKMDYFDGMRYFFQTYYNDYIRDTYLKLTTPSITHPYTPPPPTVKPQLFSPANRPEEYHPKLDKYAKTA